MQNRKAFKFYKSYYDVALELPEKDRLEFLMALLDMQFTGHHKELKGMAKFAFISQKHSIDAQIDGFLTKTGTTIPPIEPPTQAPSTQEKEKEKEKEKEQSKFSFDAFWTLYGKKVDTKKCKDKWDKLNEFDKEAILKALPDYIISTPDKTYRKNPITYLNGRCWEDEIPSKKFYYPNPGKIQ